MKGKVLNVFFIGQMKLPEFYQFGVKLMRDAEGRQT